MPFDASPIANPDPVLVCLKNARARVAHAWCQNQPIKGGGTAPAYCAHAAIAWNHPVDVSNATLQFFRVIIGRDQIPHWNDKKGRTQASVVAAFDRAIAVKEKELSDAV